MKPTRSILKRQPQPSLFSTTTTKIHIPTRQQSPRVILGATAEAIASEAQKHFGQLSHLCAAWEEIPDQRGKLRGLTPATIDTLHQRGFAQWILVEADGALPPGAMATWEVEALVPWERLSLATMLVNTNDAFAGMAGHSLQGLAVGESRTVDLMSLDSGTESGVSEAADRDLRFVQEGVREDQTMVRGVQRGLDSDVGGRRSRTPARSSTAPRPDTARRWERPAR